MINDVQTDASENSPFPINKKLCITMDFDLEWNNPLGNKPDKELEMKLGHLIDKPLLLNKLLGFASLKFLQN